MHIYHTQTQSNVAKILQTWRLQSWRRNNSVLVTDHYGRRPWFDLQYGKNQSNTTSELQRYRKGTTFWSFNVIFFQINHSSQVSGASEWRTDDTLTVLETQLTKHSSVVFGLWLLCCVHTERREDWERTHLLRSACPVGSVHQEEKKGRPPRRKIPTTEVFYWWIQI